MTRFWRSSTARFILLVFGIELILAAGMTLSLRAITRAELDDDARQFATRLTREISTAYQTGGVTGARRTSTLRMVFSEGRAVVILMTDHQGQPLVGNLDRWPDQLSGGWNEIAVTRAGGPQAQPIGALVSQLPGGARLLAGQIMENDQRLSAIVDRATGTALVFALPLALFAAFAAVRIINARVDDIAETALAVRAGRLSHRVSLDGSGDTFDRLGATLNAMLDRIEALISELRIVTDGLAHDLRSPLTRLKARLERAEVEGGEMALRSAVSRAQEEADRLLEMLTTALQISRAEAGIGRDHFASVNLSALLLDLADLYLPLAEEKGLSIEVAATDGPSIDAHRELLSQAIGNLIDNAMKYGAGTITLSTGEEAQNCWIEVRDQGAGIAPDQQAEALRRFGRLDPSRTGFGAGLGLSLVAAVARLHDGSVVLGDAGPGLIVRLTLPKAH